MFAPEIGSSEILGELIGARRESVACPMSWFLGREDLAPARLVEERGARFLNGDVGPYLGRSTAERAYVRVLDSNDRERWIEAPLTGAGIDWRSNGYLGTLELRRVACRELADLGPPRADVTARCMLSLDEVLFGRIEASFESWGAWARAAGPAGVAPAEDEVLRTRFADALIEMTLAQRVLDAARSAPTLERATEARWWTARCLRVFAAAIGERRGEASVAWFRHAITLLGWRP
jgi:hypothetical protein